MYRVRLDEAGHRELARRTREPGVMPRTRDRLEMVRLSDAGWSIPRIAGHFHLTESRVRHWIKAFLVGGFDALPDRPHVGQKSSVTPEIVASIGAELAKGDRTWTAQQIADWVDEHRGVRVSAGQIARLLRRAGLSYKRISQHLKHKQNPEQVAATKAELAKLEKGEALSRRTSAT